MPKGDTFNALTRSGTNLYRGGSGDVSRAIMWAGVGPVRAVAELIRDRTHDRIPQQFHQRVLRFFTRAFCGKNVTVALPHELLADNIDMLLQIPRVAQNLYTSFEHVVSETPINAPFTGMSLESATKKPQVAILYAYGISPDAWFDNAAIQTFRAAPNAAAFVAVLRPVNDPPLATIHATNVYADNGLDENEARRRVQRDQEVLLATAEVPVEIVDLAPFDPADPLASLDRAADALRARGVAA